MARDTKRLPEPEETRSVALSLRVRPSVKKALDAAAKRDRRTTSALCEIVLEEWLRENGFMK
jgi:hypothetical protein